MKRPGQARRMRAFLECNTTEEWAAYEANRTEEEVAEDVLDNKMLAAKTKLFWERFKLRQSWEMQ